MSNIPTLTTNPQIISSKRENPKNLNEQDISLFQHELYKEFIKHEICEINNQFLDGGFTFFEIKRAVSENKREKTNWYVFNSYFFFARFIVKRLFDLRFVIKPVVIFTDSWSYGYFHWMFDALPRLFVVLESAKKHGIILPANFKQLEFVEASLRILGIDKIKYLAPNRLFFFRKLIFPTHLAPTGNYNEEVICQMRTYFKNKINVESNFGDRIYISRAKASRRMVLNEDELVKCLGENGFSTLYLEDYTWIEQVQICKNIKYLIGMHGAGLSNMLFMNARSSVLEFRKKDDTQNNCYFSLASGLYIDYYYQLCEVDSPELPILDNNFTVNIESLMKNIKLMLNE